MRATKNFLVTVKVNTWDGDKLVLIQEALLKEVIQESVYRNYQFSVDVEVDKVQVKPQELVIVKE